MKNISLLGATGSIGVNTLEIVRQFPEKYTVCSMAAGTNVSLFSEQIREFRPKVVSVIDQDRAVQLRQLLGNDFSGDILWGEEGNIAVASHLEAEITLSAIVGSAGLLPTLAAIEAGKDIGLANKETLVMAGHIVMNKARENRVNLFPVDSEHSAIFQALEAGRREDISKIILTASGGPFRGFSKDQLAEVTPEQAISIDSATLMNKGLEVIEARWLFDTKASMIDVVVHPQSIVHSLVEYKDGSVVAQLGIPDMKIPIAYALSYPERLDLSLQPLQLSRCNNLEFDEPDYEVFPALKLAFSALESGGVLPAVLNAANEIAVDAFLSSKITFLQVAETVARTMDIINDGSEQSLDDILDADRRARVEALAFIEKFSHS